MHMHAFSRCYGHDTQWDMAGVAACSEVVQAWRTCQAGGQGAPKQAATLHADRGHKLVELAEVEAQGRQVVHALPVHARHSACSVW